MSKKTRSKLKKNKTEKTKNLKTKQKRQEEIEKVKTQISEIGFSNVNPDIEYAYKIFDDYINHGTSYTGKIKINGFKRILDIILSNRSHIQTVVCLKFDETV